MEKRYKLVGCCVILFDVFCILLMILFACQIMTQREEAELLSHFERECDSDLADDVERFLNESEAYSIQTEELKEACEELERKCNVKIYLENTAIELDCKAYLEKLFTIRKDELQIESDWLRLIYEEENEYPVGICIQNQLSDIGLEGAKLGMNFHDIMETMPEAIRDREEYDGEMIDYLLLEDERFKYFFFSAAGNLDIRNLYITRNER